MINSNSGFPPAPYRPIVQPMFRTMGIAASGLSAQRVRMETIASNIANSETTRTEDGTPYRRRVVEMEAKRYEGFPFEFEAGSTDPSLFRAPSGSPLDAAHGVRVAAVVQDMSEGPLVYDPGHPDADGNGYVRYPNVQMTNELVNLMDARRVYEANATVFQSAKAILKSSIDL